MRIEDASLISVPNSRLSSRVPGASARASMLLVDVLPLLFLFSAVDRVLRISSRDLLDFSSFAMSMKGERMNLYKYI